MRNRETAGKTAGTGAATRRARRRGTLRERIGRGKYALLRNMADALNGCSWAEKDNTPETIWGNFYLWSYKPAYWGYTLCETIDTGADDVYLEERKRRRELSDALTAHGVAVAPFMEG